MLGFPLEGLFLESLGDDGEESKEGGSAARASAPEKSFASETARGKELKQLLSNVTAGKMSLADLPRAMAGMPFGSEKSGNGGTGADKGRALGKEEGNGRTAVA